jgi:hypothetical protein
MAKEKFIQEAIKHPGALRKSLHVKEGEKIPEKKLEKAEHSKNPTTRKRAFLAETLKHMHHKKEEHKEHEKKRAKDKEPQHKHHAEDNRGLKSIVAAHKHKKHK